MKEMDKDLKGEEHKADVYTYMMCTCLCMVSISQWTRV